MTYFAFDCEVWLDEFLGLKGKHPKIATEVNKILNK